jgi:hypothetical protein
LWPRFQPRRPFGSDLGVELEGDVEGEGVVERPKRQAYVAETSV